MSLGIILCGSFHETLRAITKMSLGIILCDPLRIMDKFLLPLDHMGVSELPAINANLGAAVIIVTRDPNVNSAIK